MLSNFEMVPEFQLEQVLTKYKPVVKMQKTLTKEKLGASLTKGAVTVAKPKKYSKFGAARRKR